MSIRRAATFLCILLFGVLVQASAICHVVTCSLPAAPPACHHESSDPETCLDFAAAAASIDLDYSPVETGTVSLGELATFQPALPAAFESPSPPPLLSVLRI